MDLLLPHAVVGRNISSLSWWLGEKCECSTRLQQSREEQDDVKFWNTSWAQNDQYVSHVYNRYLNYYILLFFIAKSFIELLQYLFSLPDVKDNHLAFLSNHLCQDPLESFFGQQRQRGRTGDNPNVQEFLNNTAALRVVNGFCRGPTTGNCRLRELQSLGAENTPLCRRRRHKK